MTVGVDKAYIDKAFVAPHSIATLSFRYFDLAPMGGKMTYPSFNTERAFQGASLEEVSASTNLTIFMKSNPNSTALPTGSLPGKTKLDGWTSHTCSGCIVDTLIPDQKDNAPHHLECPSWLGFSPAKEKRLSCRVFDVIDNVEMNYSVPKSMLWQLQNFRSQVQLLMRELRTSGANNCKNLNQ